jgi:hypothetical protein
MASSNCTGNLLSCCHQAWTLPGLFAYLECARLFGDSVVTSLCLQLHPANDADRGYLRLTAATAMLRLARGHDPRILSETYFSLALTMQVSPG